MSEESKLAFERSDGIQQTRVDSEGRLKLPASFQADFKDLGEDTVFISTMDLSVARIYSKASWAKAKKFFDGSHDPAANRVFFTLMDFGQNATIDKQGRVLLKQELRSELKLESQQVVWLLPKKGYIEVLPESVYRARKAAAQQSLQADVAHLEMAGLD